MTKTSIIISVYNDVAWLEMILTALAQQTVNGFEVVIADDGSSSAMRDFISKAENRFDYPLVHVWHEDKGWRKNIILNKAIVASKGEYLIFIDGDCIPHPKFVEEHLRYRTSGRVLAGRRVQLTEKITSRISSECVGLGFHRRVMLPVFFAGLMGKVRDFENCVRISSPFIRRFIKDKDRGLLGCNFSIYRRDIMSVNGFDERYLNPATGEDTDLELRLRNIGVYVLTKKHQLTVYHKKHRQQDFSSPENAAILRENTEQHVGYTPYGIGKQ